MKKILHIGKKENMEKYSADKSLLYTLDVVNLNYGLAAEEYGKAAGDAEFLIADAIAPVSAAVMDALPHLKLIHSEGVAYNQIDLAAAGARGIYVCNSEGMNASAVAEQTVVLMTGMLRDIAGGDRAVREGRQIEVKEEYMKTGDLKELADCSVGLIGFGNIGRAVAALLAAYGVRNIWYNKRHLLSAEEEAEYRVRFREIPDLLAESDIVSLHLPVNESTRGMADAAFFSAMREGSYFVNTARGELVDDQALAEALASGKLRMAGLDTLDHEPVKKDHPLLNLPEAVAEKILFSPHIGGITASSFRRSYAMIWEDIASVMNGQRPKRVVNGKFLS